MVASRPGGGPFLPPVRALIEAYQEDASALRRFHPGGCRWRATNMGTLIEQFAHRLNSIGFTR